MGFNITPDSGTSLRKMLKFNLEPHMEQFEAISVGASKEHSLEKAMQKMEDDWDPIIFNTTLYRDTGKAAKNIPCLCYIIECKRKMIWKKLLLITLRCVMKNPRI